MSQAGRKRVFHGYWIVLGAALTQMMLSGCGMYAFSLFVKPLETAFGWSRAGIMVAFAGFNIAIALASPVVGRLADRYEPRWVIAGGGVLMGLGFGMLAMAGQLWHYTAGWSLIGVGFASAGFVPLTALLFRWFRRRRGLAVGLMGIGIGAGGFALAPVIGAVLIPQLGWRGAFWFLGGLVPVVVAPVSLLMLKSRPADVGQTVDGLPEKPAAAPVPLAAKAHPAGGTKAADAHPEGPPTLASTIRTASFWLLACCFAVFGFAMNAFFQNHVPHLQDIGFPMAAAASALSAVGVGSGTGKFLFGWFCDFIKPRYVFVLGVVFQLAAVLIIMTIRADSPLGAVWLYAALYGIGIGCWPVMSMVVSSTFGMAHYGSVYGLLSMVYTLGSSVGLPMAGYIHDATGSYQVAFVIFIAAFAVTIPAVLLVKPLPAAGLASPAARGDHRAQQT